MNPKSQLLLLRELVKEVDNKLRGFEVHSSKPLSPNGAH